MSQSILNPANSRLSYVPKASALNERHHSESRALVAARDFSIGLIISALLIAPIHAVQLSRSVYTNPQNQSTSQAILPKPAVAIPVKSNKYSSKALQALLNKWQSDYAAGYYGVVVKELGGAKRSASLHPHDQFQTASLYKVYLAQYLYNSVDLGQRSLSQTYGAPYTLGKCLELMIIISSNACGQSLGYSVGWDILNDAVNVAGFKETTISSSLHVTTASDLAEYLVELQTGTLISKPFTKELLDNMRHQIYRSAIPAGVPGISVADKVGYLPGYWHDAAIVYHPKGTYVLVVLSLGSGSAAIKDLSRRISDFMNK